MITCPSRWLALLTEIELCSFPTEKRKKKLNGEKKKTGLLTVLLAIFTALVYWFSGLYQEASWLNCLPSQILTRLYPKSVKGHHTMLTNNKAEKHEPGSEAMRALN